MNGDPGESRLPELEDEGDDEHVEVLYQICKLATRSNSSANNAIFSSYQQVFEDLERETKHDNAIFRWILRLVNIKDAKRGRNPDFVGRLRALLDEHGITVVDDTELTGDGKSLYSKLARRRVSFDDARYEETWLSNNTQTLDHGREEGRGDRNVRFSSHVRSTSHDPDMRASQPMMQPLSQHESEYTRTAEELEDIADAFYDTLSVHRARSCMHIWHNATFSLINANLGYQMIAAQHDRRMLQRQAWDTWRTAYLEREQEISLEQRIEHYEELLASAPRLAVKRGIWSAWRAHFSDVKAVEAPARAYMLQYRYFGRWKAIAQANQSRVQHVLLKKYIARWMQAIDVKASRDFTAGHVHTTALLRGCLAQWISRTRQRLQQQSREDDLAKQAIRAWRRAVTHNRRLESRAEAVNARQRSRTALLALSTSLQLRCERELQADKAYDDSLLHKATLSLKRHAETLPVLQQARARKKRRTQQDILNHWRQCTLENKRATEHRSKHLLRTSLGIWNDALRSRTLNRRINERTQAQMLYRLMLEARLRTCIRMRDTDLLQRCWQHLRSRTVIAAAEQEHMVSYFGHEMQRHRLFQVMQHMHHVMRARDDAERAATEFRNTRLMPRAWQKLRNKSTQITELNAWSKDGGFFVATKKTLQKWRDRAQQSKQDKRHQAYIGVRNHVKARLLRGAWHALSEKMEAVNEMQVVSYRQQMAMDEACVKKTLYSVRRLADRQRQMHDIASKHDRQVTARAAFATLVATHDNIVELESLAADVRSDVDTTTQGMILKRLHFTSFARARLAENGLVYQTRRHERHTRQMLRHLASTAKQRKARRQEEPESPSIRPASRATTRPELEDVTMSMLNTARRRETTTTTPAYLKTPSRVKRSKLRTIPTPAPFTPFTFTPKFLASTPAPAQSSLDATALEDQDSVAQITPFNRRLRASGINTDIRPTSILRPRQLGTSMLATDKSVRFVGASRFQRSRG